MLKKKPAHLDSFVNWDYVTLREFRNFPDRVEKLVKYLSDKEDYRYLFEYSQKEDVLAFLRDSYRNWQDFSIVSADKIALKSIEQAQGARALAGIPDLGKAWWATSNSQWGEKFQRFYTETLSGEMLNWAAFTATQGRIELDAFVLLRDCSGFSTEGRIAFLDHMVVLQDAAWDYVSRWDQACLGPEGHNWYLHGMIGLPFFSLMFPEFKKSEFYLKAGWSFVNEHLRAHYREDGGARETCVGYQWGSLNQLWLLYIIASRNGFPIPAYFVDNLLKATKFLLKLSSPAGGYPSFGDGGPFPGRNVALAAMAAAMTGDSQCKWYAEKFRDFTPDAANGIVPGVIPEAVFWMVGLEGADAYKKTKALEPGYRSIMMSPTNYLVMRNSWEPDASYMAVAAARRGAIVSSHGHNDIFSFELFADGVRYLGEQGCAPYGISVARDYDQSTAAHNCLTIDGLEQVPLHGEWRWEYVTVPYISRWVSNDNYDFFHGIHEGFCRIPEIYTLYARKIFFLKSIPGATPDDRAGYWVVMDWMLLGSFEKKKTHEYAAYFHGCVPGEANGKGVVLNSKSGGRLLVAGPENDSELKLEKYMSEGLKAYIAIERSYVNNEQGFVPNTSGESGEQPVTEENYPCFRFSKNSGNECLPWVIAPLKKDDPIPVVTKLEVKINGKKVDAVDACAVKIDFNGYSDCLCVSHKDFDRELEFDGHKEWGIVSFKRTDNKGTVIASLSQDTSEGINGKT